MDPEENKKSPSFVKDYPWDFLEAFVTILIVRAIIDKPIDFVYVLKQSIVLGLLFNLLDLIGHEYKSNLREGLRNNVGYFIFNQFAV